MSGRRRIDWTLRTVEGEGFAQNGSLAPKLLGGDGIGDLRPVDKSVIWWEGLAL